MEKLEGSKVPDHAEEIVASEVQQEETWFESNENQAEHEFTTN